ncbi:MAG: rRNA maturation RNase YbeY [Pseudodesulfovibrio sp.]|nr:rRNA maturation RNase YbeY [Pseudodesulfovibrio sp.]
MPGLIKVIRETRLDPRFPLSRHELLELVEVILDSIGLEGNSFSLKLVGDGEIARLNERFLGCHGPTNILSFPADEDSGMDSPEVAASRGGVDSDTPVFLGELALSVDALSREMDLYGQSPVGHLARLLTHGILHLAGYDHGDEMYDLTDLAVDRVLLEYAERIEGE